jgi:hypothetical protein
MARAEGTVPDMRSRDAIVSMQSSMPHAAGAVSSARESNISSVSMSRPLWIAYAGAW